MRHVTLRSSRVRAIALGMALGLGLAAHAGCSNQGEGERCDKRGDNGGNDECQDGLECVAQDILKQNSDRCCPPDRTKAVTAICREPASVTNSTPPLADTGTAGDSAATDATTGDASVGDATKTDGAPVGDASVADVADAG